MSGAEPVRAETLEKFADAFRSCGFRREALVPCYGLAEGTLMLSGALDDRAPEVISVATDALQAGRLEKTEASSLRTTRIVGCGPPVPDVEVAIVDSVSRRRLVDGEIGEI